MSYLLTGFYISILNTVVFSVLGVNKHKLAAVFIMSILIWPLVVFGYSVLLIYAKVSE